MKEEKKLNIGELEVIQKKYNKDWSAAIKIAAGGLLLAPLSVFIPLWIHPKGAAKNIKGNMIQELGALNSFVIVFGILGFAWITVYILTILPLKRDLKSQKKVIGKVEVLRIEKINPKIAKDLEDGKNTILHFEQNTHRIKKFYFNRDKYPKYMNAKQMIIERAKYSKIVFSSEVITI